jgi:hypothetical protein
MERREFIQTTAGAASGLLLLKPNNVFGYPANSAVRLGLLGCGGRGTHVATSFSENTAAQVTALADLFQNQLDAGRAHFNQVNARLGRQPIDSKLLFRGPHAYEKLAGSPEVDLIQISTPPFFHVQHLEAAVEAGKHVYCEKPMGIDVKQAKHALEVAQRVKAAQSVAHRGHRGAYQGRSAGQDRFRQRVLLCADLDGEGISRRFGRRTPVA